MKGRKPKSDELNLWNHVAKSVTPLGASEITKPEPDKAKAIDQRPTPQPPIQPFQVTGGKRPLKDDLAAPIQQQLRNQAVQMDRKVYRNMQRGKLLPDARIDLHGMTLDRAHTALVRFVLSSQSSGHRLLLVITGKGKDRDEGGPIPVRRGVLRHQVPQWLRLAPLTSLVLQITPAHKSHGGDGAYYVYLRKSR